MGNVGLNNFAGSADNYAKLELGSSLRKVELVPIVLGEISSNESAFWNSNQARWNVETFKDYPGWVPGKGELWIFGGFC